LRVNFIGNTCNNHYGLCKFLRKAGVDAHLFYDRRGDIQTFPEAEDAFLADQPTEWIHPYEATDVGPHPWHHIPPAFMERLRNCDLLQAESEGLIWAWQSGKPYIWSYCGADLNFFPYHAYWSRHWNEANPEHLLTPPGLSPGHCRRLGLSPGMLVSAPAPRVWSPVHTAAARTVRQYPRQAHRHRAVHSGHAPAFSRHVG